jgi:glutathione synthase/RimK-type ligase-like ATP-grasp enzyme
MKVGIYNQHLGGLHRAYLQRYERILQFNGIECVWLDANREEFWEVVSKLDLFIYQWEHYDKPKQIALTIIPIIEQEMKIPCFPDWKTSWHFDDKIRQYFLLKQHGFPVVESYIYWRKEEALRWLEAARMPLVFKLKCGAGSSNVGLVIQKSEARQLISKMFDKGIHSGKIVNGNSLYTKEFFTYKKLRRRVGDILGKIRGEYEPLYWQIEKDYVFFQRFLPNNQFDTRVSIIGDRAFAFRRFNRENDFRASGSGNIDYDISKIDRRSLEIAFRISKELGFQSMSYDFLMNEKKELEICEISYTYVDYAVYDCPGFWDKDLNWQEGHFWPQYCQLVDVLKLPSLKQPLLNH